MSRYLFSVSALGLLLSTGAIHLLGCDTIDDKKGSSCLESGCDVSCSVAKVPALASQLIPGFTVVAKPTGYFISSVVRNSPAAAAGITPGDKLISIDGFAPPNIDGEGGWQAQRSRKVVIDRAGIQMETQVKPVSFLVAMLGASANSLLPVAAIHPRITSTLQPFMSGLSVSRGADGNMTITAVLPRTPADEVGLKVGDKILAFSTNEGVNLTSPEHSSYRSSIRLTIERFGHQSTRQLKMIALSEYLMNSSGAAQPEHSLAIYATR